MRCAYLQIFHMVVASHPMAACCPLVTQNAQKRGPPQDRPWQACHTGVSPCRCCSRRLWPQGELRIAHCGGFHAAPLNLLVRAINVVASLLGHPIHWDTETVGCEPSLSSLPVFDQRPFAEALAELAAWLGAPGNEREFLVVFLDDQRDIATWVGQFAPLGCPCPITLT